MVTKEDLAEVAILSGFTDGERGEIASIVKRKEFLRDAPVFDENGTGGQLFVVHNGEVKITRMIRDQHEQTLAELKNGDIFGGVSFIDGKEHSATAVCITDSVIFTIAKTDFDALARKDPGLGLKLIQSLSHSICAYLRKMNAKFFDMVHYVSLTQ